LAGGIIGIVLILVLAIGFIVACVKFATRDEKEENTYIENNHIEKETNNKNKMAKLLSNLGITIAIVGFIVGLILFCNGNTVDGVVIIISSIICMIFVLAFSEIIQLLDDIKKQIIKN